MDSTEPDEPDAIRRNYVPDWDEAPNRTPGHSDVGDVNNEGSNASDHGNGGPTASASGHENDGPSGSGRDNDDPRPRGTETIDLSSDDDGHAGSGHDNGSSHTSNQRGARGGFRGRRGGRGRGGHVGGQDRGGDGDDEADENDNRTAENISLFNKWKRKYGFLAEFFVLQDAVPKKDSPDINLKFECLKCSKMYSSDAGSLSNLRKHVQRLHNALLDEYEKLWDEHNKEKRDEVPSRKKAKLQPSVNQFFKPKTGNTQWTPIVTQSQIDRAVVHFIIDCNAPYRYTEKESFKALVLLGKTI